MSTQKIVNTYGPIISFKVETPQKIPKIFQIQKIFTLADSYVKFNADSESELIFALSLIVLKL